MYDELYTGSIGSVREFRIEAPEPTHKTVGVDICPFEAHSRFPAFHIFKSARILTNIMLSHLIQ